MNKKSTRDSKVISFTEFKTMVDRSGIVKDTHDDVDHAIYSLRERIGEMTAKELKEKIKFESEK